jgi:hypothetical protein|tara:strand:+ start:14 stop:223 length:210 start_codon:yes stop_codon:yes gene_type:complete
MRIALCLSQALAKAGAWLGSKYSKSTSLRYNGNNKILVVFSFRIYTALAHSTMSGLFYFYDKLTAIVIF